ncbi:LOW QUALITY PROTEIN: Na(+)/H(+) exchange regulatory cofactor NHE-RF2 [Dromiciops gliroides]|uniref:LOW QUALITY PROTEIN: Na(+)/H(+) exchange regulatory cofactor NHE-RF2 n=1 Tax=Dromiciops gliroides TaxID=33562 RepID=UPI001CC7E4A7|nr:LOW QUALITY PROTEIN: Na(+)/H(+) exchange regulatory cofactor NHE-RF2 [Dromiciops gliroides]
MAKDQLRPRLCRMIKGEQGYGFHLHGEKGKSGQFIRKVEPGSPAEAAALRAGDRLVEVNGVNVEKETHLQVGPRIVVRVRSVEGETRLLVVEKETDEYLASLHLTCTEEMAHHGVLPSASISPQDNGNLWEPQPESRSPRAGGGQLQQPEALCNKHKDKCQAEAARGPPRQRPPQGGGRRMQGLTTPGCQPLLRQRVWPPPCLSQSPGSPRIPGPGEEVNKRLSVLSWGQNCVLSLRDSCVRVSIQMARSGIAAQPPRAPPRSPPWAGIQDVPGTPRELRPRLCHLHKGPNGYGFNLHSEKSRPGQYIRLWMLAHPPAHSGLRPQDRLIEVNGRNVEGLRHAEEVVSSIKAHEMKHGLLVVDPETDAYFKRLRVVPTEEHVTGPLPSLITNGMSHHRSMAARPCSSRTDLQNVDRDTEDNDMAKRDPFQESGLHLSPTAAEAKEKARAKRVNKRAPQMDWNKKREIFSNF